MASSNRVRHATQQLPKIHPLARFEDRMHKLRARLARRRGLLPTVIPYRGYGTATEIRVLCRVVLAPVLKPGSRRARKFARRFESVRGWRSFVSVPVANAAVTISIGLSAINPDDRNDQAALERADLALYEAKHRGRNRVKLDPSLSGDSAQP
jgi:hypothetical protein